MALKYPLITWIFMNAKEDPGSVTYLSAIYQKYCDESFDIVVATLFTRYIRLCFPEVTSKSVRNKGDWTLSETMLYGLALKTDRNTRTLSLSELEIVLPPRAFVIDIDSNPAVIGFYTNYTCKGQDVIIKCYVCRSGQLKVYCDGDRVDLRVLGVGDKSDMTVSSLQGLFSSIQLIKPCDGVKADMEEGTITSPAGGHVATWSVNGESYTTLQSAKCDKVKPFFANSCIPCKRRMQGYKQQLKRTEQSQLSGTVEVEKTKRIGQPKATSAPSTEDSSEGSSTTSVITNPETSRSSENQASLYTLMMAKSKRKPMEQQIDEDDKKRKVVRWSAQALKFALDMWTASPNMYESLKHHKYLDLPSAEYLSTLENHVKQRPGIMPKMLEWMRIIAKRENLPEAGYTGGLILDEMKTKEGLQDEAKQNLIGKTDGDNSTQPNYVLQVLFVGLTGFIFPVCYYPSTEAGHCQLRDILMEIVTRLTEEDFNIRYVMLDGAITNRSLMHLFIEPGNPVTHHIVDESDTMLFLQDPKHVIRRIRDSVIESGSQKYCTRFLEVNGHPITWDQWIGAYEWDKKYTVHRLFNEACIIPSPDDKMCTKYAERTLDDDMLNLMMRYEDHVGEKSNVHCNNLEGAIMFLRKTSVIVNIFNDRTPVSDISDNRLNELLEVLDWFKKWELDITSKYSQPEDQATKLMPLSVREDLTLMIVGFIELVKLATSEGQSVTPAAISSDVMENLFSPQ